MDHGPNMGFYGPVINQSDYREFWKAI
jgi:hypothetical protein